MAWWNELSPVKVVRAISPLPQTKTETLFIVAGGRVRVVSIVGQITTAIEAAANAAKLLHTPTEGSAIDLCATIDINAYAKGDLLSITGVFANTLMPATKGGAAPGMLAPVTLKAGNLGMNCAASKTGNIQWEVEYFPLDAGATLAAGPTFP